MKDKQIVAMTQTVCPICAKKQDGDLLISKRLQDISHMHNQVTGFSDKPCEECQAGIDLGAIMIIVIDESKSSDMAPENWWRTGNIFGLKQEAIERMQITPDELLQDILKKRVMVMDYKMALNMGLPVKYEP